MEKSKRKYKKTSCYLIYSVLGISTGILFRLSFPFLVLMMVVGFLFLPKLMRNAEKSRYHQKRFEDINSYMEQLLYSFRKSKRILASLQDIKIQFKNKPMEKLIEQAEQHILNTYDSEGDTEFEALSMIEQEYPCVKLKTIHRFLLKVENLGGSFDKTIDLLLEDRSLWEQRQNHLYQEKKRKRNLVTASIVMSILLCIVFVRILPADMDISKNIFVQSATVIMWFLDILVYAKVDEKISKDWLDSGELSSPEETVKRYKKVTEFDKKKELKKSCRYAFFLTVIAVICGCFHYMRAVWIAAAGIPFMLFQHKVDYHLAKKKVIEEIQREFPRWLMEMSLLLQSDSVQVSLFKSFEHAPEVLKPELEKMYAKLQKNPTAIEPYLEFMADFEIKGVSSAMKMLYSLSAGTGGNSENQITDILRRNQVMLDDAQKAVDRQSVASMYFLFGAPVVIGGAKLMLDMVVFFFCVFQGMGSYM